jgi:Short C-terminal domain
MGGETGVVIFDHVPRPAAVQAVITEQINALHHRHVAASDSAWEVDAGPGPTGDTPPAGTPRVPRAPFGEGSVAGRLVELDELRRRGILTEAEFASKKAELLDRL